MSTWTDVDDIVARLQKRWATGRYLRDYARGADWVPIELPVKAPTAAELLHRFDEGVRWAEKFRSDSHTAGGTARFTVTYRAVTSRSLGANSLPGRVRIESFEQLQSLLGKTRDVRALDAILEQTRSAVPGLVPWVVDHPLAAIEHQEVWGDLLATVAWIAASDTMLLYVRQIDVDGVDTKFVERHRKLLDQLLTEVLPEERIDAAYTAADFARRFRFRPKPLYTRVRSFGLESSFPSGVSEVTLRTDELARLDITASTVFVVENEITYLAFPEVPASIVVFGSGFALTALGNLPWLDNKEIVYWGDIDTHGFDILNRLRTRFDSVRSILMDEQTLRSHPGQWVVEPSPTDRPLPCLSVSEAALYRDLVEDRFGPAVRLEQERVRFSSLRQALEPWLS